MEAEKIRNTTDAELLHQQRELNDQLFRLRFQLKMGQTESLKKMRGMRKDIARIKTIMRERQLGLAAPASENQAAQAAENAIAEPAAKTKAQTKKAAAGRAHKSASKAAKKTSKRAGKTEKK